jgi:hypothetical protein
MYEFKSDSKQIEICRMLKGHFTNLLFFGPHRPWALCARMKMLIKMIIHAITSSSENLFYFNFS